MRDKNKRLCDNLTMQRLGKQKLSSRSETSISAEMYWIMEMLAFRYLVVWPVWNFPLLKEFVLLVSKTCSKVLSSIIPILFHDQCYKVSRQIQFDALIFKKYQNSKIDQLKRKHYVLFKLLQMIIYKLRLTLLYFI